MPRSPFLSFILTAALSGLVMGIAAVSGCDATVKVPGSPEATPNPLPISPGVAEPGAPSPEASPGAGSPDASPDGEPDSGEPEANPDGVSPETPGPQGACNIWQDCGIGDDNTNGFECVQSNCVCDPAATYAGNCATLNGAWDAGSCACIFQSVEVGGTCTVWQDCPPGLDSTQSGFDCVSTQCVCDGNGTYATNCGSQGGYWIAQECFCVFSDAPPPSQTPQPDGFSGGEPPICWWHFEQPPCDPDRYVDTSHYEQRCFYNSDNVWTCVDEYVQEGHYEPGACPPPLWDLRCL